MMEYDVHTVLDMLTLLATGWVVYTLRFKLADTYQDDQDSIKTYYVVRCWASRCFLALLQPASARSSLLSVLRTLFTTGSTAADGSTNALYGWRAVNIGVRTGEDRRRKHWQGQSVKLPWLR